MARATTKTDLITSSNGQFEKMWKIIDGMNEEQQTATFADEMATAGKGQEPARCACTSVRVASIAVRLGSSQ